MIFTGSKKQKVNREKEVSKDAVKKMDVNGKAEKEKLLHNNEEQMVDILHNVSVTVPREKLLGICGTVGSGKSSLLYAIMGDVSSV